MLDGFKDFFGISSPSTVFAGVGEDMMAGLEVGINAGGEKANRTLTSWSRGILNKVSQLSLETQAAMGFVGEEDTKEEISVGSIFEQMRSFAWGLAQSTATAIHDLPENQNGHAEAWRDAQLEEANRVRAWFAGVTEQTSMADIQATLSHLRDLNTYANSIAPGSVATTNNEYMMYLQQTGQLTTDLAGTIRLWNALFGG
jgi:hypothetical protein